MKALALAILVLLVAPARADDAAAKALFDQGKTLFAEGKYGEACTKLEASFKLSALSSTRGLLGACYEKIGKLASAWAAYRDSAAIADRQGNSERAQAAREKAAELEPRLAKLTIDAKAVAAIKGIEVTIDGVVQPAGALDQELPIDGGPHVVAADARGYKKWQTTVDIADGEKQQTAVPLLIADPKELETPTTMVEAHMPRQRLIGLGLMGGGGTAILVGLAFGVVAKLQWDEANCTSSGECPSLEAKAQADAAARNATVSTVVTLSGAIIGGVGAALYLTSPKRPRVTDQSGPASGPDRFGTRVAPMAGPGVAGLVVQGRF